MVRRRKGKQSIIYIGCLFFSAQIGKTEKETCDLINHFMQSFDLLMEKIKDLAERLKDIFDIAESDICESCQEDEARQQLYSRNRSYRKSKYQMV